MTDRYSLPELARRSPWSLEQWQTAYDTVGPVLWPRLRLTVEALCIVNGRTPTANAADLMQLVNWNDGIDIDHVRMADITDPEKKRP